MSALQLLVVVEDPDRLSRDMADSAFLFKEMAFYDVELLSASDGMSSFSPAAKTHFLLKGFMGEMLLDNLRDKTLRGQTARFNAGFATGGVAFGYRTTPKANDVGEIIAHVISIDEQQADVVRRIFREYLNGRSLALIAAALNAEGIPPPRSKKRTGAAAWGDSTVRGMLRNEAYAGIWQRCSRTLRHPSRAVAALSDDRVAFRSTGATTDARNRRRTRGAPSGAPSPLRPVEQGGSSSMTSIAFSWKWCPESRLAISSSGASLRVDQVIDCSFKGYERQPLALSIRVPPTS